MSLYYFLQPASPLWFLTNTKLNEKTQQNFQLKPPSQQKCGGTGNSRAYKYDLYLQGVESAKLPKHAAFSHMTECESDGERERARQPASEISQHLAAAFDLSICRSGFALGAIV